LGNQSHKPEGLKRGFGKGLASFSVNPEDAKYREQAPMFAIGIDICDVKAKIYVVSCETS
jgi:hypothetical protein